MNNQVEEREKIIDASFGTKYDGVVYHLQQYVKDKFMEMYEDDFYIKTDEDVGYAFNSTDMEGFHAMKDYMTTINALTICDINEILTAYKEIMEEYGFTTITSDIYNMVNAILFNIANKLSAELGLE